jgi:hypothetical protein
MIVDIVDAVVCSSIHDPIISYVQVFEKPDRPAGDAPFILQDKPAGFQGQNYRNSCRKLQITIEKVYREMSANRKKSA